MPFWWSSKYGLLSVCIIFGNNQLSQLSRGEGKNTRGVWHHDVWGVVRWEGERYPPPISHFSVFILPGCFSTKGVICYSTERCYQGFRYPVSLHWLFRSRYYITIIVYHDGVGRSGMLYFYGDYIEIGSASIIMMVLELVVGERR